VSTICKALKLSLSKSAAELCPKTLKPAQQVTPHDDYLGKADNIENAHPVTQKKSASD
jgi:hypothetical protein